MHRLGKAIVLYGTVIRCPSPKWMTCCCSDLRVASWRGFLVRLQEIDIKMFEGVHSL